MMNQMSLECVPVWNIRTLSISNFKTQTSGSEILNEIINRLTTDNIKFEQNVATFYDVPSSLTFFIATLFVLMMITLLNSLRFELCWIIKRISEWVLQKVHREINMAIIRDERCWNRFPFLMSKLWPLQPVVVKEIKS